jgi:maltose O-acetyltransferase
MSKRRFTGPSHIIRKAIREVGLCFRDFLINGLLASELVPSKVRVYFLRALGLRVRGCKIAPRHYIGPGDVIIGRGSFLNVSAYLEPSAGIQIGSRVMIGPRVAIITTTHPIGATQSTRTDRSRSSMIRIPVRVRIEDDVWIGLGTTILPGVAIGRGAVVAAGSVVTSDVDPNVLVAGVPAKFVRRLPI